MRSFLHRLINTTRLRNQSSTLDFSARSAYHKLIMNQAIVGGASHREHRPPIRILQVVGMMNRGGAETWLMHVLRNIDREKFHIDFLVGTTEPCAYDAEIRSLGGRIIPCLGAGNPLTYGRKFTKILQEYGPYDVVHGHIHHYNGMILRSAARAGVPIRICHSHLDSSALEAQAGWVRRAYLKLMKSWIARYATAGLGCSDVASANLFGNDWQADPRWQLYYCGIDLSAFDRMPDRASIRQELGIPEDAFVIGHVGRFQAQKNHAFLVDIFAELLDREPQAYLLLLGEGPLRAEIERLVIARQLDRHTLFAGSRPDVPRLMVGAMDAFVMPSLCEGLPLVGIEVQAAGLPSLLSDEITQEVCIVRPLVEYLSLSRSAASWAEAILRARQRVPLPQSAALTCVRQSPFNIQVGVPQLTRIYTGGRLETTHPTMAAIS
jgi:glycosyltransferase involved in cell wall biosynthesis